MCKHLEGVRPRDISTPMNTGGPKSTPFNSIRRSAINKRSEKIPTKIFSERTSTEGGLSFLSHGNEAKSDVELFSVQTFGRTARHPYLVKD